MYNLKIDPEFRDLIPPLTEEELNNLQMGILADGCRDPLTVWNHTIIDGHNRYGICRKFGIEFKVNYKNFESRDEAIEWILRNQLGRRNLTDFYRSELALKYQGVVAKRMKERQIQNGKMQQRNLNNVGISSIDPIPTEHMTTNEELAKIAGTSASTIKRSKIILEEGTPEQIERARQGGKGNGLSTIANEIRGKSSAKKKESVPESVYQEPDFGENEVKAENFTETKAENSDVEPKTKICKGCGRELPIEEFTLVDGKYRRNKCKICSNTTYAADQQKHSLADAYAIAQQLQNPSPEIPEETIEDAVAV